MARVARDNGSTRTWLSDVRRSVPPAQQRPSEALLSSGPHWANMLNTSGTTTTTDRSQHGQAATRGVLPNPRLWLEFHTNRRSDRQRV